MLCLENVTVKYGERVALDDVSASIADGERVALVGPNGAGKTTFLKALARKRGETAFVPQDIPNDLALRCRDFVMLGRTSHLSPWRAPSTDDEASVDAALAATSTAGLADRRLDAVSGGERQRLALALAIATGASVLLMDEPTSHLDLRRQSEFFSLIETLKATIVMSVHDLSAVPDCFTRVILFSNGKIVADGAPAAVLTPQNLSFAYGVPVERVDAAVFRVGA